MTEWNLPPGVTTNMIPGNRPRDIAYERLYEEVQADFEDDGQTTHTCHGDNGCALCAAIDQEVERRIDQQTYPAE